MNYHRSEKFRRSFKKLSPFIQDAFYKQASYLLKNLHHPSLRAKKYDEVNNIWQARITRNVRLYFLIEGDAYFLIEIYLLEVLPYIGLRVVRQRLHPVLFL